MSLSNDSGTPIVGNPACLFISPASRDEITPAQRGKPRKEFSLGFKIRGTLGSVNSFMTLSACWIKYVDVFALYYAVTLHNSTRRTHTHTHISPTMYTASAYGLRGA